MKYDHQLDELLNALGDAEHEPLPLRIHGAMQAARVRLAEKPTHIWPNPDERPTPPADLRQDAAFTRIFHDQLLERDIEEVSLAYDIERATVRDLIKAGWVFTAWADGRLRFEKPAS